MSSWQPHSPPSFRVTQLHTTSIITLLRTSPHSSPSVSSFYGTCAGFADPHVQPDGPPEQPPQWTVSYRPLLPTAPRNTSGRVLALQAKPLDDQMPTDSLLRRQVVGVSPAHHQDQTGRHTFRENFICQEPTTRLVCRAKPLKIITSNGITA